MKDSPFLALGLPFGASREEANVAFARRARALRRGGTATKQALEDATRALNEIEEGLRSPEVTLDVYRIPAIPTRYDYPGTGLLAPPPERLRRSTPSSESVLEELRCAAAREILDAAIGLTADAAEIPSF